MCCFLAAKKQEKEGCTRDPATPNSTETARQAGLQCPCNFGNTGLSQVLLNLFLFPTTVLFPSAASPENSGWSYSAPEIQGVLLKGKDSQGLTWQLPRAAQKELGSAPGVLTHQGLTSPLPKKSTSETRLQHMDSATPHKPVLPFSSFILTKNIPQSPERLRLFNTVNLH